MDAVITSLKKARKIVKEIINNSPVLTAVVNGVSWVQSTLGTGNGTGGNLQSGGNGGSGTDFSNENNTPSRNTKNSFSKGV